MTAKRRSKLFGAILAFESAFIATPFGFSLSGHMSFQLFQFLLSLGTIFLFFTLMFFANELRHHSK